MNYIKIGPVRIPYQIKNEGSKKIIKICGLKLSFTTIVKDGQKYYRLFFLTLRLPFLDKYFIFNK